MYVVRFHKFTADLAVLIHVWHLRSTKNDKIEQKVKKKLNYRLPFGWEG